MAMGTWWMAVIAIMLVAVAAYAQYTIPSYTAGTTRVLLTRVVLLAVGVAVGFVAAQNYGDVSGPLAVTMFLAGFGLVHLPAAMILFIKRQRGAGKT
jgi:hypothetical protein